MKEDLRKSWEVYRRHIKDLKKRGRLKKIDGMGDLEAFRWKSYIITKGVPFRRNFSHAIYKLKDFDLDLEGDDYDGVETLDLEFDEGGEKVVRVIKEQEGE